MAIKFFNVLKGLTKIFKTPDVNNPITEQVSPSNYTSDAISSGITEDSIVHINCDSSDAAAFGAHYLSGTDVLMVNGSPFVDAKNIVHGISTQIAYGTIYFLAPKGLLKNTDEVRIGRIKRTKNWSPSKDAKTTKGLTVPYIDYIEYNAADGSTVTYQKLHLQWALNDDYSTIEKFGIANYDDTELITETLFINILLNGAISGTGTDPKFKIGDKIAFSIWRDGYQISDWFTWRIAEHAAGVDHEGNETAAKNILVPSKGLYLPGIQEVTSAKLMKKLQQSKLVPGRQYKIVDYDPNGTLSDVLPTTIPAGEVCVTAISKCEVSPIHFDAYNAYVNGGIHADSFTTTDGTPSQFLMADGSTLDGLNATATKVSADSDPSVTFGNGTFNFSIPSGKDGAKGDKGDTGATGATGPQGSVKSLSTDGSGAVVTNVSLANDALTISKGDVGGRNLLREGKWRNATITSSTYLGNPVYSSTLNESTASGTSTYKYMDVTYTGTLAGLLRNKGVYTVSFYAKASAAIADSSGNKILMHFYNINQSGGHYLTAKVKASWGYTLNSTAGCDGTTQNISLTTAWQKYYVTYTLMDTVPEESTCNPSLILFRLRSASSGTTVYFSNVKLEEGAVPTAWCPAHEDLEIGGRNLLKNSANPSIGVWGTSWASGVTDKYTVSAGDDYRQITINTAPTNAISTHAGIYNRITNTAWADRKITISAMLYSSYADKVKIGLIERYNNNNNVTISQYYNHTQNIAVVANKWQQVSWTFESVKDLYAASGSITPNQLYLIVAGTNTPAANAYWRVKNWKVEFGNKPTDWTPAPEDVDASIATAQSAAQAYADDAVANRVKYNTAAVLLRYQSGLVKFATLKVDTSVSSDNFGTLFAVHDTFNNNYYGLIDVRFRWASSAWTGTMVWVVKSSTLSVNIFSAYYDSTTSTIGLYCTGNSTENYRPIAITQLTGVTDFGGTNTKLNWTMTDVTCPSSLTTYTATGTLICTSTIGTISNPTTACLRVDGQNTMNAGIEIKTNGGDSCGILLRDKLNGDTYNVIGIAKTTGSLSGQVTAGYGDLVIGNQSYPMVLRTKGDTLYHYNGSASYKIYDRNNLWIALALSGTTYDTTYLPNGDLNDLKTAGFYSCSQSSVAIKLTNCPTSKAFGIQVYPAAGCIQILTEYNGGATYIRTYYSYGDSWSSWKQIYYDSDVAAKFVQKAGDTMTGNLAIATATDPTLTLGSSTIKYNSTTGCLEIKA